MKPGHGIVVIGGSAGSLPVVSSILSQLPKNFSMPIVLCLHRMKEHRSGFAEALSLKSNLKVVEPEDKTPIRKGVVYLAPSNYHLFGELGNTFALSTEETHMYSRPSIDLTFDTFSYVYRNKMIGIILSGANTDGAMGLYKCHRRGGLTILQDPDEASISTMIDGCRKLFEPDKIFSAKDIVEYLKNLISQN